MKNRILALILAVLTLSSCSEYNRVQKGRDMDAKLNLAIRLYNKGDYYKALPLFEELITTFRGTKKAERTYYYYAYTNYKLEDYEAAAYDFENFAKTYPSSEFTEECSFMHAYCYYQSSPQYTLDQTNTLKAINELQLFADRFPRSSRVEECNKLIDRLRGKLELKSFEQAELYYNMDSYKAAITSYKNVLKDYPSTNFREEALFKILRASYLFAENSIEEKKVERYNDTLKAYTELISAFPDSKYKNKAEDIEASAHKKLARISGVNTDQEANNQ